MELDVEVGSAACLDLMVEKKGGGRKEGERGTRGGGGGRGGEGGRGGGGGGGTGEAMEERRVQYVKHCM